MDIIYSVLNTTTTCSLSTTTVLSAAVMTRNTNNLCWASVTGARPLQKQSLSLSPTLASSLMYLCESLQKYPRAVRYTAHNLIRSKTSSQLLTVHHIGHIPPRNSTCLRRQVT
jgi:hypothetical protein